MEGDFEKKAMAVYTDLTVENLKEQHSWSVEWLKKQDVSQKHEYFSLEWQVLCNLDIVVEEIAKHLRDHKQDLLDFARSCGLTPEEFPEVYQGIDAAYQEMEAYTDKALTECAFYSASLRPEKAFGE